MRYDELKDVIIRTLDAPSGSQDWFDLQWTLHRHISGFEALFEHRIRLEGLEPAYLRLSWPQIAGICERVIATLRMQTSSESSAHDFSTCDGASFYSMLTDAISRSCAEEYRALEHTIQERNLPAFAKLCGGTESVTANYIFSALGITSPTCSDEDKSGNIDRRPVFSALNVNELVLVSRRDAVVARKHGEKGIEKLFEFQLSLLMQSLGFYVFATGLGERTVDLVCSSDNHTFLLEAKTSKKPYTLPVRDERALLEYVEDARRGLKLLPRLRFVLIVAYEASSTLDKRLIDLEAKAGIPIRFCSAQHLANLRESVVGPIPPDVFMNQVLTSSHILAGEFAKIIANSYEDAQVAFRSTVATFLKQARGRS